MFYLNLISLGKIFVQFKLMVLLQVFAKKLGQTKTINLKLLKIRKSYLIIDYDLIDHMISNKRNHRIIDYSF